MKNIYLVGMPSSGKSTLGKELARNLGYSFTDMDKLIETREQKTVSEIFSNYGETHFRELEKKTLRGFQPNQSMVIATGGGVVENISSIEHLKNLGMLIYLKVDFSTIKNRLTKLGRIPNFVDLKHFNQRDKKYLGVCDRNISLYPKENIEESFAKLLDKLGDLYGQ
jgi:shikimate kinase